MDQYIIKDYQRGVEEDQARIGFEVARHWIWPYAYDLEDLLKAHAQPDFDPATRHYCYLGGEMVGYMFSLVEGPGAGGVTTANLEFPRMLPGHEEAALLLIEKAMDTLKERGVSRVTGRVTSMCPGDVRLAEEMGFAIKEWGYKVYYSYEMGWGSLRILGDAAEEVDPERDLEECARIATSWYKRPEAWCLSRIKEWYALGLITHLGVRKQEKLIAACMAELTVNQYTTFTLSLNNSDGTTTITRPVFVRVAPSGSFIVQPDSIPYEGGEVTLVWSSVNAVTASLDHGIGPVALDDSMTIFLTAPTSFTLSLFNPFGSASYSHSVFQKPFVPRLVSIPPESLVAADPLTGRITKPARRGRGYAPNWANLLSEVVVQGGFEPSSSESDEAGGMLVGIASMDRVGDNVWRPNPAAASSRSWVRLTKWQFSRSIGASFSAITASLEGREGRHVGAPRGFDSTGTPGEIGRRLLLKQLTKLAPKKHNNRLFAELVALKFNIAASQLGKTPAGFGDLIYNVDSSMCDGLMITEISDRADSIMTFWRGRPSAEYIDIYNAIRAINRAFTAPMDTISFESNGQLMLRGVVELSSIPFLLPPAGRVVMRTPTSTLTTGPDDELEEGLYEDDGNPQISKLFQNFPNPFNPTTTISVGLREAGLATVEVYNILGQRVASLLNQVELDNGIHRIEFPAGDLASGVYFYRLTVRSTEDESLLEVQTKKMLLMK